MDSDENRPDSPRSLEEVISEASSSMAYELQLTPQTGCPRKVEITPDAKGDCWYLREYEYNGCLWRQTGSERLADFSTAVTTAETR